MDIKLAHSIHALQLLEAIERHLGRSSDKLQQLGTLLLVEAADGTPEPLNLRRRSRVVVVFGIVSPVVDVNLGKTRDEELELLLVKDGNQLGRDNVVETLEKLFHLLLDAGQEAVLNNQADVLLLVLVRDGNVAAVGYQIDNLFGSKHMRNDGKRLGENVLNVILEHPAERLVVVEVERLHILEGDILSKNTLQTS